MQESRHSSESSTRQGKKSDAWGGGEGKPLKEYGKGKKTTHKFEGSEKKPAGPKVPKRKVRGWCVFRAYRKKRS